MSNNIINATKEWFTEHCTEQGYAFSMQIKQILHKETTPFQTIDIYETAFFGNIMVIDGFTMLTQKDNFIYHEMMSHPILFTHPNPKNILIIGGGDCGTLKEVARHPVETITQVEIDEQVTKLSEKYFPELCVSNKDKRVKLVFEDAIKWIKNTKPNSLDIIIIDSTDPVGPGEGLFTQTFYENCLKAITENGIIIHQSESPMFQKNLLQSMRQKIQKAGFSQIQTIFFPLPTYPSGWWSATMASKNHSLKEFRKKDAQNFKDTLYYSPDIHEASMCTPKFITDFF